MCFALYLATSEEQTLSPFEPDLVGFNLDVWDRDSYSGIRQCLTLPYIYYVGSSTGCSCGYRNVMFQGGDWPHLGFSEEDLADSRGDHEALANYLEALLKSEPHVELYGAWEGNEGELARDREEITPERLRDPRFGFRENVLYRVLRCG